MFFGLFENMLLVNLTDFPRAVKREMVGGNRSEPHSRRAIVAIKFCQLHLSRILERVLGETSFKKFPLSVLPDFSPIQAIPLQCAEKSRRVEHTVVADVRARVERSAARGTGDERVGGNGADDQDALMLALEGICQATLENRGACFVWTTRGDPLRQKSEFER